jgi:ubiquinone/menaquinone biosynthesis C-methylase UbiE
MIFKTIHHKSATNGYYDKDAPMYDHFNHDNVQIINQTVAAILQKYCAKRILDLSCGTGSQVFYLRSQGLYVVGYDISLSMLTIARNKAVETGVDIELLEGDMRYTQATCQGEKFDAGITICNSIGHLTREDFQLALANMHRNLKPNGLYIFDIINAQYMKHRDNITELTMDRLVTRGDIIARDIQFSYINADNVLTSYTMSFEQYVDKSNDELNDLSKSNGDFGALGESNDDLNHLATDVHNGHPTNFREEYQTLQCYTADETHALLNAAGFVTLQITDMHGHEFSDIYNERMVVVGQRL